MNTFKALIIMALWTTIIGSGLYFLDAHKNYQDTLWAGGIGLTLLVTHMVNMVIYFKIAGDKPYKWSKYF
jgi:cell division protein FtsW (lipid II flippase)